MKEKMYIVHIIDEYSYDEYYVVCYSIENYIQTIDKLKEIDNFKITAKLYQAVGEEYPIKK